MIVHIKDLTPDPKNARKHGPRNVGTIEHALNEVGAARSIVVDEDGMILAGNATVEAAAAAGIERVQVVDADGETIIAVRRSGLTPEQKVKLALYDNRAAELADGWDVEKLLEAANEGIDLSGMWRQDELDALLAEATKEAKAAQEDPGPQIDKADELRVKWGTAVGQVWELGEHRLACGDCTDRAVVKAVMRGEKADAIITDPPYNVDKTEWDTNVLPLLRRAADLLPDVLTQSGVCFWFTATRYIPQVIEATNVLPYRWMFIWYPSNNMAHGDLGFQKFTAALVLGRERVWRKNMQDLRDVPIRITREDPGHPTPKPLELIEYLVEMASKHVVFDGFLGSGTTLVACERLSRKCRAIELSPSYCAVTLQRWHDMTGLEPRLVTP